MNGAFTSAHPRVIIAVGRQQERRILEACLGNRTLRVVGRCNSAIELVHRAAQERADVVLVDDDLHLLDADHLDDLTGRKRLRVVLLAHDPESERWRGLQALVLPWTADPPQIHSAIERALKRDFGRVVQGSQSEPIGIERGDDGTSAPECRRSQVVALFGGPGAPGRTTMAVNLLAVLGASTQTVLVDLDMTGSAVAAHLRTVQPAWNIVDIALKTPRTADEWDAAMAGRLQRIGSFSEGARVLCGVGRPRERSILSARFVGELITQLRRRFDHVLLDLGDEPLLDSGVEALVAGAALRAADHILLVAAPDPVRLHHAQMARDEAAGVLELARTSLLLNRTSKAADEGLSSSAVLDLPLAACVPFDAASSERLRTGSQRCATPRRVCGSPSATSPKPSLTDS